MADGTDIPTDVLVYILKRFQDRRLLRLVCRRWRDVVDTRLRSPAMMLLNTVESVYFFDDLITGPYSLEMPVFPRRYTCNIEVVGTCNGIVCLCDLFGDIVLYNPLTSDKLVIPSPRYRPTAKTLSFTQDQATGRYMIVHVEPYYRGRVMVFTLGEAAWRDVVIPHGFWGRLDDGFVTIGSMMYWDGWDEVRSFDLASQRGTFAIPLPSPRPTGTWRLTEVHGRLGIAFSFVSATMDKTEVWVLENGASAEPKHDRWSRWCILHVQHRPGNQPQWHDHQHLTWPHFTHGNNHILTWKWSSTGDCALYLHMVSNDNAKAQHGTVVINERNQGTLVANIETKYDTFRRFDYVKTMQPVSVYRRRW